MDDKTTKIPSLKEFQNSQKEQAKRQNLNKRTPQSSKPKTVKGDNHRVDLNHKSKGKSTASPEIRERKVQRVSSSTQKIYSGDDRFKAFEGDTAYRRRSESASKPLTQTRKAGQKPQPPSRPAESSQRRPVQSEKPSPYRKKKKKPLSPFHRKVRRVLIYALIVLAILTVGIILSMTVLFKTENIIVNVPDNFYSAEDVINASGLRYQDNIFMAGKERAEKRLEEKFPYIKKAEVTAVIPDTIKIDITLSAPSFAVKTDKLTYIANEDCKVLDVVATSDEAKVAVIEGVKVKDAKAGEMLEFESTIVYDSLAEMFNLAREKGYKEITRVDIESNSSASGTQTLEIRYVYDDRIVVYLGIPENITYKMRTAQTIIDEKLDVNGAVLTGELDVSQCYDTKKSYFNQYSLIPQAVITEPSSEATEPTEALEEYYEDYEW